MVINKTKYILTFVGLSALTGLGAQAAGIDNLRPHRAVYDLSLKEASNRSGITGMNGRIVYEMTGSKCEGFAVRFRFLTQVQTPRKSFTNDQRTTSFESGDGQKFTFVNQSYLNGQLEQELRGNAQSTAEATMVELTKPDPGEVDLGPSIFMTQHIGMLIDAAKNEETIVTAKVFDASDDADELVDTTAIIGKMKDQASDVEGESKELTAKFAGEPAWPISVSYFSTSDLEGKGEKTPVYQVSFLMHESGVSRRLKMQYEDYALKGDLKEIEYLPAEKCE